MPGDVFDPQFLQSAFEEVETAYYFVHSMGDNRDFESQDRIAAENFATEKKGTPNKRGRGSNSKLTPVPILFGTGFALG